MTSPTPPDTASPLRVPCPWCGKRFCSGDVRWDHERKHSASETTWRRRVAAAALQPDSLDGEPS